MGFDWSLLYKPKELRAILQWKVWHDPVHERQPERESENLRQCYVFLNETSRSFSSVIQELKPELREPVMLFYLILRALDTIEDDMTIGSTEKEQYLREFSEHIRTPGWTFNKCGPNEKDRQLLERFDIVIDEFLKVKPVYQEIIVEKTRLMSNGMADYCNDKEHLAGIKTIEAYDQYCYYVAGLVGFGLTDLFIEAKLGNPALKERPELPRAMGLFLQKTNIIRDIREDLDDGRQFWPREIWSKYVDEFADLCKPENEEAALQCSSDMVLNALRHASDCLMYLAGLREQSVFNFCAIPQVMAIATLHLVFRNPAIFQRNVKISKGEACGCMLRVGSLRSTSEIFREYVRKIHKKNVPSDPNFLQISIACGRVEQWIENIFPTMKPPQTSLDGPLAPPPGMEQHGTGAIASLAAKSSQDAKAHRTELLFMYGGVALIFITIMSIMMFVGWLAGARFDLAFEAIRTFNFTRPNVRELAAKAAATAGARDEL